MPKYSVWILFLGAVMMFSCGPRKSFKSDQEFYKGLAYADSAAVEPLDVLKGEVLPNEEIEVPEKEDESLKNLKPDNPPFAPFRVQVISAVDPANAKKVYDELLAAEYQEVYLVKHDSTWKVRLGSLNTYQAAELLKVEMIGKGYEGAWIVVSEKLETVTPDLPKEVYGYRIQIGAFSDKTKAEVLREELQTNTSQPVYIEAADNLWKLHVGNCTTRNEADSLKEMLKSLGYSGFVVKARIESGE